MLWYITLHSLTPVSGNNGRWKQKLKADKNILIIQHYQVTYEQDEMFSINKTVVTKCQIKQKASRSINYFNDSCTAPQVQI